MQDLLGMTGQLDRGEADVAGTIMAQCCNRIQVLDYTLPIIYRRFWIYFHQPDLAVDIYSGQFQPSLWLACLCILIKLQVLMMIMICVFQKVTKNKEEEFSAMDNLSWSLGKNRWPATGLDPC